ncbi:MAG TPA: LarC family nickel insertion protein, partial [Polyangiaceae bacterium]|nr:LarC family nickel insertion protein [Polyangiaceae bacterium]
MGKHHHHHGHDHDHHDHHDHDHDHDHDHHHHDHGHHQHGHDVVIQAPDTALAEKHRSALERGAGRNKVLFFDMESGIAGDMTIAALVDLGVPFSIVEEAVRALGLSGYALELARASAGAIGASHFDVKVQADQPHRHYRDIDAMIARAPLDPPTKALAQKIFLKLAEAEAEVHRTSLAEVAFHEVGAVDSIVDVVGAAACLSFLEARVIATPAPLGRGHVHCAHGTLPLPAPAALLCLRGVPTVDSGLDVELVTPTGAAIVATVAESFTARWP